MTALTVGDIFARVQNIFGDVNGIQITEAKVIIWINDAQREAVMQHEGLLVAEAFIDTVAEQQVYTLPEDLFALSHLYAKSNNTYYNVKYMSTTEFDEYINGWSGDIYGPGMPLVWTRVKNGEVTLFPKPDIATVDGIKIIYSRYPVNVTVTASEIDLPDYYHAFVEHFCMMKAYEMDEDWEASDRKAALLQSNLDFNNGRESWFGKDSYPAITPKFEDYF